MELIMEKRLMKPDLNQGTAKLVLHFRAVMNFERLHLKKLVSRAEVKDCNRNTLGTDAVLQVRN